MSVELQFLPTTHATPDSLETTDFILVEPQLRPTTHANLDRKKLKHHGHEVGGLKIVRGGVVG
jgi:hypothetical protein